MLASMSSSSNSCDQNDVPELTINNKYKLTKRIFMGTFSEIRIGENIAKGTKVAAKLEMTKNKLPLLQIEYGIYKLLQSETGFPEVYYYGQIPNYNVLVMQILGKNLEQVFNMCKRQFSLKTILYNAIQLITRLESIHRNGIVYRDVKPENFLLGTDNDVNTLHVIDFGLSKRYLDPTTQQHISMSVSNHITGTARYVSLNGHKYCEQSRRDDLESLGYLFVYWLRQGKLPWSGFKGLSMKERYLKIFEYKYSIPIETLCHGFPAEFANYLRYARSIGFDEEPSYHYLQNMFVELFQKENYKDDGVYDWSKLIKS